MNIKEILKGLKPASKIKNERARKLTQRKIRLLGI